MALIKCPECGKEISDKAPSCPNCGCPISTASENSNSEAETQKVEVTGVSLPEQTKKRGKTVIVILCIALAVILIAVIGTVLHNQAVERAEKEAAAAAEAARLEREEKYQSYIDIVPIEIMIGASDCEECGGLLHDVWYNTIFKKSNSETDPYTKTNGAFNSDFNDSIRTLFADKDFAAKLKEITDKRNEVEDYMRKMADPPEKYRDAYNAIKELYDSYVSFTNLVTSPSGNLTSYTESFNSLDQELASSLKSVNIYMSEGLISYQ